MHTGHCALAITSVDSLGTSPEATGAEIGVLWARVGEAAWRGGGEPVVLDEAERARRPIMAKFLGAVVGLLLNFWRHYKTRSHSPIAK